MASSQFWVQFLLQFIGSLYFAPVSSSDDHIYRFVKKEKFLGLTVPECPRWQCEGRCDATPASKNHGCRCDMRCLLYGDCCYDFYSACLRLPDDEIRELLAKGQVEAYKNFVFEVDDSEKELHEAVPYQQCVPYVVGSSHIQRLGVYLISSCPESWRDNNTRELCEEESENFLNSLPVFVMSKVKRHYRNIHCAVCHGAKQEDIIYWENKVGCTSKTDLSTLKSLKDLLGLVLSNSCDVVSSPPVGSSIRPCWLTTPINTTDCDVNTVDTSPDLTSLWYVMVVRNENGTEFRNPHEAISCQESGGPLTCFDQLVESSHLPGNTSVRNVSLALYRQSLMFTPVLRSETGTQALESPNCAINNVFDHFQFSCIPLECPSGWYAYEGQCLPTSVSPIPADYTPLPEGDRLVVIKIVFKDLTGNVNCDTIWEEDLFKVVYQLVGLEVTDITQKTCKLLRYETFRSKAETNVYGFKDMSSVDTSKPTSSKNSSDTERYVSRRKKRDGRLEINSGEDKHMADSSPVLYENPERPRNEGIVKAGFNISRSSRTKQRNMLTASIKRPQCLQIKLEASSFDSVKIQDFVALIKSEVQNAALFSNKDWLLIDSVEFSNYNHTPICHTQLQTRSDFQIYQQGESLFGYDSKTEEQIPLDNVPFKISVTVNDVGKIISSTNALLCDKPIYQAPNLPKCQMQIFENDDFVYNNNSLYINSTQKSYERGRFRVRGKTAYVCLPENQTNSSITVSVNRGFFTMPYTQYVVVLACCCLSLACLFATFVTYVCFAQLRDISGIILMCLTASLFVAQLLFARGIDLTDLRAVCVAIAISLHFLWLSVFAWMNVLTYDIAHKLRLTSEETADKDSKAFKEYCIFAWGVPFLLVGICAALDFAKGSGLEMEYAKDSCWIGSILSSAIGFALPACLLLLANLALFVCTIYALQAVARVAQLSEKQRKSRRLLIIYSTLTLIMGLSWGFAYLAYLTEIQELWFAFGALSALQGIFTVCGFVLKSAVLQLYKNRFGGETKSTYPPEEFL